MLRSVQVRLNGAPFLAHAELATAMFDRMRGLIGRDRLEPGHGLILKPCTSIHMIGVRFPIDAIFLARDGQVVRIVRSIAPGVFYVGGGRRAHATLEIAAGWLSHDAMKPGDRLEWNLTERPR